MADPGYSSLFAMWLGGGSVPTAAVSTVAIVLGSEGVLIQADLTIPNTATLRGTEAVSIRATVSVPDTATMTGEEVADLVSPDATADDTASITGPVTLSISVDSSVAASATLFSPVSLGVLADLESSDTGTIFATEDIGVVDNGASTEKTVPTTGTIFGSETVMVCQCIEVADTANLLAATLITATPDVVPEEIATLTGQESVSLSADALVSADARLTGTESISAHVLLTVTDSATVSGTESLVIPTQHVLVEDSAVILGIEASSVANDSPLISIATAIAREQLGIFAEVFVADVLVMLDDMPMPEPIDEGLTQLMPIGVGGMTYGQFPGAPQYEYHYATIFASEAIAVTWQLSHNDLRLSASNSNSG